jgi:hypothetical protein
MNNETPAQYKAMDGGGLGWCVFRSMHR